MSDSVFYVENADEAMNRAMEKARLTRGYFWESLQDPKEHQESFSAKIRFQDGDQIEHIWLKDIQLDGDSNLYGTVNNEPAHVTNVQMGSRVGVGQDDLSDWMVVENGRLIGGYTIRAYRNSMSPAQREDFDASLGLVIDEGVDYFPHDHQTPEGAILCLEDAFTAGNIDAACACKDFLREAGHMLARVPKLVVSPDIVQSAAQTLETGFREYFTEHGMPSFENVERAFLQREFENEDTVVVTEHCRHPDGMLTVDRIWVYRVEGEWKVGPPANEDP